MFKGSFQTCRTETSCNIPWDDTTIKPNYILETGVVWNIQGKSRITGKSTVVGFRASKGKMQSWIKASLELFRSFHLLPSNFWKWKHLYLVIYAACGALMTTLLRNLVSWRWKIMTIGQRMSSRRSKSETCKASASKWNAIPVQLLGWIQSGTPK